MPDRNNSSTDIDLANTLEGSRSFKPDILLKITLYYRFTENPNVLYKVCWGLATLNLDLKSRSPTEG